MKKFPRACLTAAMFTLAAPAFALFPEQGMWTIGSELDGKPGRGVQIDRQGGRTVIITYFGYRADGSSMFLQASGALKDGKTFTGELSEFKNGRALAGPQRSGEVAQVAGPVSIEFDTSTTGSITLPGESPQRFSRFQYEDHSVRINGGFVGSVEVPALSVYLQPVYLELSTSGNELYITERTFRSNGDPITCTLAGNLRSAGDGFASDGAASCDKPGAWAGDRMSYRITDLKVDEYGVLNARLYYSSGQYRYYTATCQTNGAYFGSPSRCRPQQYGLDENDLRE